MSTSVKLIERPEKRPEEAFSGARRGSSRWASTPIRASSDRRLAQRASNGDQRAIAAIFERYQKELYSFCVGLLGEPQDAQDALQNTMVKVLRALPGEEREIALRPWLYRIAHNEAIELRRSRRPTQALEGHLVDRLGGVPELVEQREQLEWVLKDLADLPERQRSVLVMRELSGLDFAEIGAALDTTGSVVRQSLYEARRNLEQMDRGRSLRCDAVTRVISDSDRRITRRRDIRAHLRECPDCRHFRDAIEGRKGALSTIPALPLPVAAGAGVVQSVAGGSAGGGAAAALSGAAKSVGALKAAGAIAAVAVVGTVAVDGGMMNATPSPPFSDGQRPPVQAGPGHRPAISRRAAGARAAGPSARLALRPSSGPASAQVSNRRARSLPIDVRGAAAVLAVRPGRAPQEGGLTAGSQGASVEPDFALQDEPAPPSEPEGSRSGSAEGKATEKSDAGQSQSEKHTSTSAKPEQDRPDHPAHPAHPENGHASAAAPPLPGPSAEPAKTPPGQAKKQARDEEPAPAPVTPASAEPESTTVEADAEPPVEGAGSNGKAKGHEK